MFALDSSSHTYGPSYLISECDDQELLVISGFPNI